MALECADVKTGEKRQRTKREIHQQKRFAGEAQVEEMDRDYEELLWG